MHTRISTRLVLVCGTLLAATSVLAQTGGSTAPLPYDLAQVAQRYPVTLYTTKDCAPCDSARAFLQQRGIPFSEKTIGSNADLAALKDLAHTGNVPALTIGTQTLDGFSEASWSQYLDAAGYPKTSQLPKGWQNAAATPLAPSEPAGGKIDANAPAQSSTAANEPPIQPAPNPNNPAGIRF